jgi:uncharacterized protein (DUF58 family)
LNNSIDLKKLESVHGLEFMARQVVEGFITGLHKSPFHGFSVEFAEHRLYNNGESTRHIDWKLFARTDKLFVKRFEEETNLRCQLVIDSSSSMYFPENTKPNTFNKIEFSVYAAAALVELLRRQRDAIGLSLFSSELDYHIPARSSVQHINYLYSLLSQITALPSNNKSTSASDNLHIIAESIPRRSLVIIFSDMLDNPQKEKELFGALQHLIYNKHEVILFHTLDKKLELDFEFENRPYTFVDMESGEELKLHPTALKEYYTKRMSQKVKELKLKCAQYRIDYIEADINAGFDKVLNEYLVKRTKMIK